MLLKNKIEIEEWLKKYDIDNYKLIPDDEYGYVINVYDDVNLSYKRLNNIDIKFNIVNGDFICSDNKLKSLKGCPEIVDGDFYCHDNKLTSLIGCPKIVKGDFDCSYNNLSIDEIKNLLNIEIKNNFINLFNNEALETLQNIDDFNELKKILTIYKEKSDLMMAIEVTDNFVEKRIKI